VSTEIRSTLTTARRVTSIDGLRGVAALMILAHHLTLTNSWYDSRVDAVNTVPLRLFPQRPWTSTQSLLEWSPLHMLYASNAVYIFFVISGLILVGPVRRFSAHAYGVGRLVRLYVPIVAAAALAVVFAVAYHSHVHATTSRFLNQHVEHLQLRHVTGIIWLLDGGVDLNPSLWTMRYEVIFSLILPAVLWRASKSTESSIVRLVVVATLVAVSCIGVATGFTLLTFIPIFFVGVVLSDVPAPRRGALWILIAGVVSMNLVWVMGGFHVRIEPSIYVASTVVGAALIVHAVRARSVVASALDTRPMQYLGRRSYSLYLVQVPAILFVWLCISVSASFAGQIERLGISLVLIAGLTELFYCVVEQRAISWSRSVTRRLNRDQVPI